MTEQTATTAVSTFGAAKPGQAKSLALALISTAQKRFGDDITVIGMHAVPDVIAARYRMIKAGQSAATVDEIVRYMLTTGGEMVEVIVRVPSDRLTGPNLLPAPKGQN